MANCVQRAMILFYCRVMLGTIAFVVQIISGTELIVVSIKLIILCNSFRIPKYIFNKIVQQITDGMSCTSSWDCDTTKGLWCGNITNSLIYKKCV